MVPSGFWRIAHLCFINQFSKNDIGWPQQSPTAKVLKFNMIFYDSTPKNFFSKQKYKANFKCLDDSEVLSSDFPGLNELSGLSGLNSLKGLNNLDSLISSKNLLILMV